jgi:hypothetical protein
MESMDGAARININARPGALPKIRLCEGIGTLL